MAISLLLLTLGIGKTSAHAENGRLLLVVGAHGTEEFGASFEQSAAAWARRAQEGGIQVTRLIPKPDAEPRAELQALLQKSAGDPSPLWLVLLGHGTFDGREARFNLDGPDITASELGEWLQPHTGPIAVALCFSCSAPFVPKLAGKNRVILSATKSGYEMNYSRFGAYLAEAMADPSRDLDKDQQVSLLEGFLSASRRTLDFYEQEGRLATEHPLLDDNGDGLGVPAEWFQGVVPIKKALNAQEVDGRRAHQWTLVPSDRERNLDPDLKEERNRLELELFSLRDNRPKEPGDAYFAQLERLLTRLAGIYQKAGWLPGKPKPKPKTQN